MGNDDELVAWAERLKGGRLHPDSGDNRRINIYVVAVKMNDFTKISNIIPLNVMRVSEALGCGICQFSDFSLVHDNQRTAILAVCDNCATVAGELLVSEDGDDN